MTSNNCSSLVKSLNLVPPKGASESDVIKAICLAVDYSARPNDNLEKAIADVTATRWPTVSKSVDGGLSHFISVDNGSVYAELWHTGDGNWYTVASEAMPDPKVSKSSNVTPEVRFVKGADWTGIFEIPKVHKGMRADLAAEYFTRSIFGPNKLAKGGCGCKG